MQKQFISLIVRKMIELGKKFCNFSKALVTF